MTLWSEGANSSALLASFSDKQLMHRLAKGQVECLGVLYERHDSMVKMAIGRFAPEISEAEREELVQDIFMALNDSASRFPEEVNFRGWLYGIVANKTRKWRRNTWARRRLLREKASPGVGMALEVKILPDEKARLRQLIRKAVTTLPPPQRDVFILHAAEGFSGEEIAEILGISHRTVRTRLHRARKRLCEYFEKGELSQLSKAGA